MTTAMSTAMPELDALVEVEGGAEVAHRAGHDLGVGPGDVAGEGDALVLEQLLELLLGHLTGRDLALEAVVLLPQAVVLGLEVALVEGAAPGVADGAEDRGAGVAHRARAPRGWRCGPSRWGRSRARRG